MQSLFRKRLSEDLAAEIMLNHDLAFVDDKLKGWTDALMRLVGDYRRANDLMNDNFTAEKIRQTLFCCIAAFSLFNWQVLQRRGRVKHDITIWYLDIINRQTDGRHLANIVHEMMGRRYSVYQEVSIMPFDTFIRIALRELGLDKIAMDKDASSYDVFDTMRYLFDSNTAEK